MIRVREGENETPSAWRFVLGVWLLSRLFYLVAGAIFARTIPSPSDAAPEWFEPERNVWGTWDGGWYATVAQSGYAEDEPLSTAFFPLYPMLMRLATELFGRPVSVQTVQAWGVLISSLAFLVALYFVYRIAEDGWGWRAARGAVLTLAFFPTAFYFNAVYTESLFLALSAGSLWAVRLRKDLLLAALLAALATLTRHVGILLLIPLLYEWIKGVRDYRFRGAYLALVPSGLVAYMAFLRHRFGDPLLFQKVQESEEWERTFTTNPLTVLGDAWAAAKSGLPCALDPAAMFRAPNCLQYSGSPANTYDLLALFFVAAMLVVGVRHLPLDLYVYAFLFTVPFALYGVTGAPLANMSRLVLVAFPLFIVLGVVLQKRWALIAWLIPSAAFSLLLCARFVSWRWVA